MFVNALMTAVHKEVLVAYTHYISLCSFAHSCFESVEMINKPVFVKKMTASPVILLQSMTSTSTMDVDKTVAQVKRIVDAGANMVRISTQNIQEVKQLQLIKDALYEQSYHIPLIADTHYNADIAELAATIVEKVRINPGNYTDKKQSRSQWSDEEYQQDLNYIKERLKALVAICKKQQTSIRIGVNHGSLSDRIVYKYGNTVEGMVESAMEFIHIFQALEFNDLVISLKASHVILMVESNRMLYKRMREEDCEFPLHLGVTEAGDAEDGRIKSAIGIGVLLAQGIGDTIRVSLTEEPENEIPVCQKIVRVAKENPLGRLADKVLFERRKTVATGMIGGGQLPIVIQNIGDKDISDAEADFYFNKDTAVLISALGKMKIESCEQEMIIRGDLSKEKNYFLSLNGPCSKAILEAIKHQPQIILIIEKEAEMGIQGVQHIIQEVIKAELKNPMILRLNIEAPDEESFLVQASVQAGAFLLEAQLDGLWLESGVFKTTETAFGILQASRQRMSKTEYIACPSCGRTLFNIQQKLQEIKRLTKSYKGLKIAVMGCMVNGLGEMADANYGYVGSANGCVDIYKGHELIKHKVDENIATQELLNLIELYEK